MARYAATPPSVARPAPTSRVAWPIACRAGRTYVAISSPISGADVSQTTRFNASVGVIRMKNGFGITAVGTPSRSSAPAVARTATSQKRRSSVEPSAATLPGVRPTPDVRVAIASAAATEAGGIHGRRQMLVGDGKPLEMAYGALGVSIGNAAARQAREQRLSLGEAPFKMCPVRSDQGRPPAQPTPWVPHWIVTRPTLKPLYYMAVVSLCRLTASPRPVTWRSSRPRPLVIVVLGLPRLARLADEEDGDHERRDRVGPPQAERRVQDETCEGRDR